MVREMRQCVARELCVCVVRTYVRTYVSRHAWLPAKSSRIKRFSSATLHVWLSAKTISACVMVQNDNAV